eukprot:Awhi_evm1s4497
MDAKIVPSSLRPDHCLIEILSQENNTSTTNNNNNNNENEKILNKSKDAASTTNNNNNNNESEKILNKSKDAGTSDASQSPQFQGPAIFIPLVREEKISESLVVPVGSLLCASEFYYSSANAKSDKSQITVLFRSTVKEKVAVEAGTENKTKSAAKKEAKRALKEAKKLNRKQELELLRQQQEQQQLLEQKNKKGQKSLPIPDHLKIGDDSSGEKDCLITPDVEREHVQRVYDTIATHWHGT